jgi:hypothetical protein
MKLVKTLVLVTTLAAVTASQAAIDLTPITGAFTAGDVTSKAPFNLMRSYI